MQPGLRSFDLPDLTPDEHILMIRAADAAGNTGTGDAVFEVE